MRLLRRLFDLSRGRQALLSVAQPALGAVLALGRLPDGRSIGLGLIAATCGYLAVFSLNDVLDAGSDVAALRVGKGSYEGFDLDTAFDRHPVALGVLPRQVAVAWVATLAVIAVASAWLLNPWCVAFFAVSVACEGVYCALRNRTWAKTFISGVMVGVGALAGWVAVAPLDIRALGFFGFLAAWEIAGRNLPNDLSDLAADRAVGLHTVATTFGPRASSRAITVGSVATMAFVPALALPAVSALGALSAAVAVMFAPAIDLLRAPSSLAASRYFNRASLLPAIVFLVVLVTVLAKVRP